MDTETYVDTTETLIAATMPLRDLILDGILPDEVVDKLTEAIDALDTACDLLVEAHQPSTFAFLDFPPETPEEEARWEEAYFKIYGYDTAHMQWPFFADSDSDYAVEICQYEDGH